MVLMKYILIVRRRLNAQLIGYLYLVPGKQRVWIGTGKETWIVWNPVNVIVSSSYYSNVYFRDIYFVKRLVVWLAKGFYVVFLGPKKEYWQLVKTFF